MWKPRKKSLHLGFEASFATETSGHSGVGFHILVLQAKLALLYLAWERAGNILHQLPVRLRNFDRWNARWNVNPAHRLFLVVFGIENHILRLGIKSSLPDSQKA